jgi:2-polyprenyl-3-methyl-5-hydroxy-6-metoxy-1,4-benzoquinol methylase
MYPQIEDPDVFYRDTYRENYNEDIPKKEFELNLPEARERLNRIVSMGPVRLKNSDVLEVGCSYGSFMFCAKPYVKSIRGVEPSSKCREFAKKKRLRVCESLKEVPEDSVDIVCSFHVLEHVPDPIQHMIDIRTKIKKNGYAIIEVPNINDILVSTYKIPAHLNFYFEAAHQFCFSEYTLSRVLKKAGFNVKIFPLQRYDISNHVYWMLYQKPGGKGKFEHIFGDQLNQEYVKCLEERNMTDTLYAVATPKVK